jgi:hypothetical protein
MVIFLILYFSIVNRFFTCIKWEIGKKNTQKNQTNKEIFSYLLFLRVNNPF